tara:strand:- start:1137 stop:1457 length:321 start_codon:yes stop_codon:yes gene_type:complete
MGYSTANDLANGESLEKAVSMHFKGNCYPPIPQVMVEVGVRAIYNIVEAEICRDYDLLDELIQLPKDESGYQINFKGSDSVKSIDAVEGLYLGAFVDSMLMQGEEE